jgi:hypothetical protein
VAANEVDTGLFSTPGELKAAADRLDAEITNIDNAIDGNDDVPQSLWDGFQEFRSRWKAYYSETYGSPVWSWLTSRLGTLGDQLQGFVSDAQAYGQQLQKYGAEVPGGLLSPDKPFSLGDLTKPLTGLGISLDVALGLAIVAFIVWKVMK